MTRFFFILSALLLLLTGCGAPESDPDARAVLMSFFSYLRQGNYAKASTLYGGGENLAAVCKMKDAHCLKIKRVVEEKSKLLGGREFVVEFVTPSGALYAKSADGALTTQFTYTVEKEDGGYKVQ